MSKELAVQPKVEIQYAMPILEQINKVVVKEFEAGFQEIIDQTNTAIERGVVTAKTANDAETARKLAKQVLNAGHEIRMMYTRPIDEGKKTLKDEVDKYLKPLQDASDKLNLMVKEEAGRKAAEKRRLEAEAFEKQRLANEEARKEEERRINISKSKGGTGENVKPVAPEKVIMPTAHITMQSTTTVKRIIDKMKIQNAVTYGSVREIPGVRIYPVWNFEIVSAKNVPDEWRKDSI